MHMGFQDCKVKIFLIEGRRTLENGLLVEVWHCLWSLAYRFNSLTRWSGFWRLVEQWTAHAPFCATFCLSFILAKEVLCPQWHLPLSGLNAVVVLLILPSGCHQLIGLFQDDIDMLFDNEDSSVVASLVPKDSIPVPAVIPGCGGTTSNVNGADQAEEQRIKTTTSTLAGPVPAKVLDETDPGTVLAPPVSVQVGPKGKSVSSKIPFKSTTNFASASSNVSVWSTGKCLATLLTWQLFDFSIVPGAIKARDVRQSSEIDTESIRKTYFRPDDHFTTN